MLKVPASSPLKFACGDDPVPLVVEAWNTRAPDPLTVALAKVFEQSWHLYESGILGLYGWEAVSGFVQYQSEGSRYVLDALGEEALRIAKEAGDGA